MSVLRTDSVLLLWVIDIKNYFVTSPCVQTRALKSYCSAKFLLGCSFKGLYGRTTSSIRKENRLSQRKTLLKYENRPWIGYVVTVGVLGRYESPYSNEGCCFKSWVQIGEFLGGSCWGSIKHTSHGDMAAQGRGDVEVTAGQMQGLLNNAFLPFEHSHRLIRPVVKRFWANQLLGGLFCWVRR